MSTFYIYKLNSSLQQLFRQYPGIKQEVLSLEPKNPFFTKQIEILFESNDNINEYLYEHFKDRSDYKRDKNIHKIHNILTNETIICKVNDYSIEINASKKRNIFYDILYQYSKRYVIMDEQCIKQEV